MSLKRGPRVSIEWAGTNILIILLFLHDSLYPELLPRMLLSYEKGIRYLLFSQNIKDFVPAFHKWWGYPCAFEEMLRNFSESQKI